MNIKIVTWLGNGNYGTILQAYALNKVLQNNGYKTSVLYNFETRFGIKSYIKYLLICANLFFFWEKKQYLSYAFQNKFYYFTHENFSICQICTHKQYKRLLEETDVFVAGSDQIWNASHDFVPFYFLDFAGSVKRISYASSMGCEGFPEKYVRQITEYLSRFKYISVREQTAKNCISNILMGRNIEKVCDPTFLLNKKQWQSLSTKYQIKELPPQYVLCYFIGDRNEMYKSYLDDVISQLRLENVVIIPSLENRNFHFEKSLVLDNVGPLEFVSLINGANLICTDSFHATALSLNLSKNFVEFMRFEDNDPKSQNSRIYDLLSHYGLSNKIYNQDNSWQDVIDYNSVEKQIEIDRSFSEKFLFNAIEN